MAQTQHPIELDPDGKAILVNFDHMQSACRFFGGDGGPKRDVLWNHVPWLIKKPGKEREAGGAPRPQATNVVSEWLGSRVFDAAGVEAQEAVLGTLDGRLVVALRDFRPGNNPFLDLRGIAGRTNDLARVLEVIRTNEMLRLTPGAEDRFWNTFVIDALIGNPWRTTDNWGIFFSAETCSGEVAPVFDNGSATLGRHVASPKGPEDPADFRSVALEGVVSAFRDADGRPIDPFALIASACYSGCNAATRRIVERLDKAFVYQLIDAIPESVGEEQVLSPEEAAFHKRVVSARLDEMGKVLG